MDASARAGRLAIGFSTIGHLLMHLLAALYVTVVLALETEWSLTYDELIRLWTLGSLMIGLGAPLAGWLGDRWSDARMMVVFFLLTGAGAIAAGLADDTTALWLGLAMLGLGASIYHPVGMSWLVKNADNPGRMLGIQGIFGSVGVAIAAVVAGTLIDLHSWRAAFLVPGTLSVAMGLLLVVAIAIGATGDRSSDRKPQPKPARGDVWRAFVVLSVTMVCAGLVWNAMQVAMPKLYEIGLGDLVGGSTLGIGGLVTLTYLVAATPQLIGGALADRFPIKWIYLGCLTVQIPLLGLIANLAGLPLMVGAVLSLMAISLQIPAENLLLARYTPGKHRGLAYGAKFILTFGVGPLAVQLVALTYDRVGSFEPLFIGLSLGTMVALAAACLLPSEARRASKPVPSPVPAAALGGAD